MLRLRSAAAFAVLCLASALTTCRGRLPEVDTSDQRLAAGQRVFERRCASCHNSNGDGKTITASRFPYANLIDGKWRGDGSQGSIEKQVREFLDWGFASALSMVLLAAALLVYAAFRRLLRSDLQWS